MSTLYIEPFSGLSGDMFLGALCGLTGDYELIESLPDKLGLPDARVVINEVNKNGIVCKHVKVIDLASATPKHRHLSEIHNIIESGQINDGSKVIAKAIFNIVGISESKIHGIPLDQIHFHELSGVDSIIDIVGSAVILDLLTVEKTYCEPVCTGFGFVKAQHGILPVPAPATADILINIPTFKGSEEGEKTTPTGAAILRYLKPEFSVPVLKIKSTAYGPGQKDFKNPNVLRVSLVELAEPNEENNAREDLYMVESNIDDTSAEYLGTDFQDDLLKNGAIDFYFTPVQMKKGRPGILISVLVDSKTLKKVSNYILENTSSIGLRYYPVSREKLERRAFVLETKYGRVKIKEVNKPSGDKRFKIEYESLKELSKKNKISIQKLQSELMFIISTQSSKEKH